MDSDLSYYKKRCEQLQRENELKKQENQILSQELSNIKKIVQEIFRNNKDEKNNWKNTAFNNCESLRSILEFQRNRIECLEKENIELKNKYEFFLFDKKNNLDENQENNLNIPQSKALFAKFSEGSEELLKANKTILMLENKLKELNTNYAKEIIGLKTQLTKYNAEIIIYNNEKHLNYNNSFSTSMFDIKKKESLAPISANKEMKNKIEKNHLNKSVSDATAIFNYKK